MKTTTTTTTTNAKTADVAMLLERVEHAVNTGTLDDALLYAFGHYVVFSVVKKHFETSGDDTSLRRRRNVARDRRTLDRTTKDLDDLLTVVVNASGRMFTDYSSEHKRPVYTYEDGHKVLKGYVVKDSAKAKFEHLSGVTISYDFDLVHDAILALYDVVEKSPLPFSFTRPYTVHQMDRRVYIRLDDSKAIKEVETTAIKEVFRAVRRKMIDTHSAKVETPYSYEELRERELSDDADDARYNWRDADADRYYIRLEKYADVGGYVHDFNGAPTVYTVDHETVQDYAEVAAGLKLSSREAEVLRLRRAGYGKKAIGKYLGVRPDNVKVHMKRIQAKAIAAGLNPDTLTLTTSHDDDEKVYTCEPCPAVWYPVPLFADYFAVTTVRRAHYAERVEHDDVPAGTVISTREWHADDATNE